jgi:leader peptidase (prepilin peptidase)/N-methyltransferase
VIGSFLNVCIYRLPLGLSVNQPRRSFCPSCKAPISWFQNIPVLSWLCLKGRCAKCHTPIPARYPAVELLTASLFVALWIQFSPSDPIQPATAWILPLWIFASLLIVATFIDLEHYIIPDEITLGGTVAGLLFSTALPVLHQTTSHTAGALWSIIGAATGFFSLWAVVELGKLAFGKKRVHLDSPQPLRWTLQGDDAEFVLGDERSQWSEMFARPSDRLLVQTHWTEIQGERWENVLLTFEYEQLSLLDRKWNLNDLQEIRAAAISLVIPREAMGFGDVKFMACIGAFLGWKAALFTFFAASCLGACVGLTAILLRHRDASARIPFGPYLAAGALLWMFAGPTLVHWWLALSDPHLG